MEKDLLEAIANDFQESDRAAAIRELESITLDHVMAQSAYNLRNTRFSVLYLAKGDLNELRTLTQSAKFDFRDVIMWATLDRRNENE